MVVYDRIYIRFKNRVLGPLAHEKVSELVATGQITPEHDMSSDGVTWKKAKDFQTYFPSNSKPAKDQASGKTPPDTAEPAPVSERWYIHIEGQTPQAYEEAQVKLWIKEGRVTDQTLIWKPDIDTWHPAGELRPQWFAKPVAVQSVATTSSGASSIESSDTVSRHLIASKPFVKVIAIVGLLLSLSLALGSLAAFFMIGIGNHPYLFKLLHFVAFVLQIVAGVWGVAVFIKLLSVSAMLAELKFRSEVLDIGRCLAGLNSFWKLAALLALGWITALVVSIFLIVVARSLEPKSDEEAMRLHITPPVGVLVKVTSSSE